jgi:glycerol-3-phosphate dehydrogenase (NAD(P)+)
MTFDSVGIVGGGAWGTALAQTLRLAGRDVALWAREAEVVAEINGAHANTPFLPGVALDPQLQATGNLTEIATRDVVLMVAPAQHVRAACAALAPHFAAGKPLVMCAKGLEQATGKLLGEVAAEALPQAALAILSGNYDAVYSSSLGIVEMGIPGTSERPRYRKEFFSVGITPFLMLSPPSGDAIVSPVR